MQNLRERRSETSVMYNRADCSNSKNTGLVKIPSKEGIQLDKDESQQLETW